MQYCPRRAEPGISVINWGFLLQIGDPNWQVVGTADFNADGAADILWLNQGTDETLAWLMSGTSLAGWGFVTHAP